MKHIILLTILTLILKLSFGQTAAFTASQYNGCAPTTIKFTDNSTGGATSWAWNFGNTNTSTGQNPSATYMNPGIYTVNLTINGGDVATTTIEIYDIPKPDFTVDDLVGCAPHTTDFTGSVNSDHPAAISSWNWNFGDGVADNGINQTPNHTYNNSDIYPVLLTVIDDKGCKAYKVKPSEITVNPSPVASFTPVRPNPCGTPYTMGFTDLSTIASPATITKWEWDFGDGSAVSNAPSPTHDYTAFGIYSVNLTVTTADGCSNSYAMAEGANYADNSGDFSAIPTSICVGDNIPFTDLSIDGSVPSGSIRAWTWDFGDGLTGSGQSTNHTYSKAGVYDIKLSVLFHCFCLHDYIKTKYITVKPPPTPVFSADRTSHCKPYGVTFDGSASSGTVSVDTYAWDFGDGTTGTGATPYHEYKASGNYTVKLTVTSPEGCSNTLTKTDYITIAPPVANPGQNITGGCLDPGFPVQFTSSSTSLVGTIVSWNWDFGDGSTSTDENPIYTYNTQGKYDVSLAVTTSDGCTSPIGTTGPITPGNKPNVAFTVTPNGGNILETISFVNGTTGTDIKNTIWNYGIGSTSGNTNGSKKYTDFGKYKVTLTTETDYGCEVTVDIDGNELTGSGDGSSKVAVTIYKPKIKMSYSTGFDCGPLPRSVDFFGGEHNINTTVNPNISTTYEWDFGDGGISTDQNPTHSYTAAGDYTASLTIKYTDPDDLSSTERTQSGTLPIAITAPTPASAITAGPLSGCSPLAVTFNDADVTPSTSWKWDFDDGGNTSNSPNPIYTFNTPGTYDVVLTKNVTNGCESQFSITIDAYGPTAKFTTGDYTCKNTATDFTDNSTSDGLHSIVSWDWDFDLAHPGTLKSTDQNPVFTFNATGAHRIGLTVEDDIGCTDYVERVTPIIIPYPQAKIGNLDNDYCISEGIPFKNESDTNGDDFTSVWTFTDGAGTISTSTATNPTHGYGASGVCEATLAILDEHLCPSETSANTNFTVHEPVADFTANREPGCAPVSVDFFDNSSTDVMKWDWTFSKSTTGMGSQSSSVSKDPTNFYMFPGSYDVQLIVTTDGGCTSTVTKPNYIHAAGPIGYFEFDKERGCIDHLVNFEALGLFDVNLDRVRWDFGDGVVTSPGAFSTYSHTYDYPGSFLPILTLEHKGACGSYAYTSIQEFPRQETGRIETSSDPVADFPDLIEWCEISDYQFMDKSTNNATAPDARWPVNSWKWDFGDSSPISTAQNPFHSFDDTNGSDDKYTVNLTVSTGFSCQNSISKEITIIEPTINSTFSVDYLKVCLEPDQLVNFTDLTTSSHTVDTWNWEFPDGATSTLENPTHTFDQIGNNLVKLTAMDKKGCIDIYTTNVIVDDIAANFSINTSPDFRPAIMTFNDLTTTSYPTVDTWSWSFADGGGGGTDNVENPVYTFNNIGTYDVVLTSVNTENCQSTSTIGVEIKNNPPTCNFDMTNQTEDVGFVLDVLGNNGSGADFDIDLQSLTVIGVGTNTFYNNKLSNQGATLSIVGNSVQYTPPEHNNEPDFFYYRIEDSMGATCSAQVSITFTATNDPPVAENDKYVFCQTDGTYSEGTTSGLLVNDEDIIDNDPISAIVVTNDITAHSGTISIDVDGAFTYKPAIGFSGFDTYIYTITDGLLTDDGIVSFNVIPSTTPATTGGDQYICDANIATLTGNTPGNTGETGTWTVSGQANLSSFHNPVADVTTLKDNGDATFTWKIESLSGTCSSSTAKLTIFTRHAETGNDIELCDDVSVTLNAYALPTGIDGKWSILSAASTVAITNTVLNISDVTGLDNTSTPSSLASFLWTVDNTSCSSTADVNVTVNANPVFSAGTDYYTCAQSTLDITSTETFGTGVWNRMSPTGYGNGGITTASAKTTQITGIDEGEKLRFRRTVTNGNCTNFDEVDIFNEVASAVDVDISACDQTSTAILANKPVFGSGKWTSSIGAVTFEDETSENTNAKHLNTLYAPTTHTAISDMVWTITNSGCVTTSTMVVTNDEPPTFSAGTDQYTCAKSTLTITSDETFGSGTWSRRTPTGYGNASITTASAKTTEITGVDEGEKLRFRRAVTNGECSHYEEVDIFNEVKAVAVDIDVCETTANAVLANTPIFGSGEWTSLTASVSFVDETLASTNVTGLKPTTVGSPYNAITALKWKITNGACSTFDDVIVTNYKMPVANAGADQIICSGEIATLQATQQSYGTGLWSKDLITTGSITTPTLFNSGVTALTLGEEGIYTWTITNKACVDIDHTLIRVALPANAGSDADICAGNTYNISGASATGFASLLWTTSGSGTFLNSNTLTPTYVPSVTDITVGNVTLTLTDASGGGCDNTTNSMVLTIHDMPLDPILVSNSPQCNGNPLELKAVPYSYLSYNWISPDGSSITTSSSTLQVATTDSYYGSGNWYVSGVIEGGCATQYVSTNVSINPIPTAIATSPEVCASTDAMLNANTVNNANYKWYSDAGLSTLISTNQNTSVSGASNGDFYYLQVELDGCAATSSIAIQMQTQDAAPTITLNGSSVSPQNLNGGDNMILSTNITASSYLWTGPNGYTSTLQSPSIIVASQATSGTYFLKVYNDAGCESAVDQMVISIDDCAVTPTLYSNSEICNNEDLIMTASPSNYATYQWTAPDGSVSVNTTSALTVSPGNTFYQDGTWLLSATTSLNCTSGNGTAEVKINPMPISLASTDIICANSDAMLSGNDVANANYRWYNNSAMAASDLISTNKNTTVSGAKAGDIFYLEVSVDGCSAISSTTIQMQSSIPAPVLTVNIPCAGGDLNLEAMPPAGIFTYSWVGPNSFTSSQQNPIINNVTSSNSGSYLLTITSTSGCSTTASIVATVNSFLATPTISGTDVCENQDMIFTMFPAKMANYQLITPNGTIINNSASYSLTVNSASLNYQVGTWQIIVTDENGCSNNGTANVSLKAAPIAIATSPEVCASADAMLNANTVNNANYKWYSDDGLSTLISTEQNVAVSNVADGTPYYLQVEVDGCTATSSTEINKQIQEAAPTITLNGSSAGTQNFNSGDNMVLSTNITANSYLWTGPNGYTSTLQTPPVVVASPTTSGTYFLKVYNDAGCESAVAQLVISVDDCAVTPTLYSNSEICNNEDLIMTASPSNYATYQWTAPDGSVSLNTTSALTVSPGNTFYQDGTWLLSATTSLNCTSGNGTAIVKINPMPISLASTDIICANSDAMLSGNDVANANYKWYDDAAMLHLISTNKNTTVSSVSNGDLFYLEVSVDGCSAISSIAIQEENSIAAPVLTVNVPCAGGDMNLEATPPAGIFTYSWIGPNSFASSQQNPIINNVTSSNSGSYLLTITSTSGCSTTASIVATVNSLKTTPAITDTDVCANEDMMLTLFPAGLANYRLITPDLATIDITSNSLTITQGTANYKEGIWQIIATDNNGCSNSGTANISIKAAPIAIATSPEVCANADAMLNANSVNGANYKWFSNAGLSSLVSTEQNVLVSPAVDGKPYYLEIELDGCTATASTEIQKQTQEAAPIITLNGISISPQNLNSGDNMVLSTNITANSYLWTGPNAYTSTLQTPPVVVASPTTSGTYFLKVYNDAGCESAVAQIVISVDDCAVTPTLYSNSEICNNEDLIMTASPSNYPTYKWTAPDGSVSVNTTSKLIVSPGTTLYQDGTWLLSATTSLNCTSGNGTAEVKINPMPISLASTDIICTNVNAMLSGNSVANANYKWYKDAIAALNLISTNQNTTVSNVTDGDAFYLEVSVDGCSSISSTTIQVQSSIPAPVLTVNVPCAGGDMNFEATPPAGTFTYAWSGPNGFVSNLQNPTRNIVTVNDAGLYSLVITNTSGCSTTASIVATVNSVTSTPTMTGNEACDNQDMMFTMFPAKMANYQLTTPNGTTINNLASYSLTFNSSSPNYQVGTWQITVTDDNGCSNTGTANVSLNPVPIAIATSPEVCANADAMLNANTVNNANYKWYSNAGLSTLISTEQNVDVSNVADGTPYYLQVEVDGCAATSSTAIQKQTQDAAPAITLNGNSASSQNLNGGDNMILSTNITANSYLWIGPNGYTSTLKSPPVVVASPITSGTYFLKVYNDTGCESAIAQIVISVDDCAVTPTLFSNSEICNNEDLIMTASPSNYATYQWTAPNGSVSVITTSKLTVSPGDNFYQDGIWQLQAITSGSCASGIGTAEVIINPMPISLASTDIICVNSDAMLSGNDVANANYRWYNNSAMTASDLISTNQNTTVAGVSAGDHFYLEVSVDGCSATSTTTIQVQNSILPPVLAVNVPCAGGDMNFEATPPAGSYTYLWSGPNNFSSSQQNPIRSNVTTNDAGKYSLTITSTSGCSTTASIVATVNSVLTTPTMFGDKVCENQEMMFTLFPAGMTDYKLITPDGNSFSNGTSHSLTVISSSPNYQEGTWQIVVTDANGCSNNGTADVSLNPVPIAIATTSEVCASADAMLNANSVNNANYKWFSDVGLLNLISTNQNTVVSNASNNDAYYLQVELDGCKATSSIAIKMQTQEVAPVITLNGNSINSQNLNSGENMVLSTNITANSYLWIGPNGYTSTLQTPPVVVASPITSGTYFLKVYNDIGCESAVDQIVISVDDCAVTPTLFSNSEICNNEDLIMTASPSNYATYQWIAPNGSVSANTTSKLTVSPGNSFYQDGTWQLQAITSGSCASGYGTAEVVINPMPISLASSETICTNSDAMLSGNDVANANYRWYKDAVTSLNLISTNKNTTVANTVAGDHFYLEVSVDGCSAISSTTIQVPSSITPPILTVNVPCDGGDMDFIATLPPGSYTYSWSGPNNFSSNQQNPIRSNVSINDAGKYSLTITNAGGCSAIASVVAKVNSVLTIPTMFGNKACKDQEMVFTLFPPGMTKYELITPNNTLIDNSTSHNLIVSSISTNYQEGTWQIIVTDANGCTNNGTTNVSLNPVPIAIATSSEVCASADAMLNANTVNNANYKWYSDAGFATLISTEQNAVVSGSTNNTPFYLQVELDGCAATSSTVVKMQTQDVAPVITLNGSSAILPNFNGGDNMILSTTTTATNYEWTGPNGYISTQKLPPAIIASPETVGTYYLKVYNDVGCESAAAQIVVNVVGCAITPTLFSNSEICDNQNLVLTASPSGYASYKFTAPNGEISINTSHILTVAPSNVTYYQSGKWLVSATTASGCESENGSAEIVINKMPIALATSDVVCANESAIISGNTVAGANYKWFNNSGMTNLISTEQNATVSGVSNGQKFYLEVSVGNCASTAVATIQVQAPISAPSLAVNTPCTGGSMNFTANPPSGIYTYAWTGPNGFISNQQNPVISNVSMDDTGVYSLTITNANGCSASANVTASANQILVTPLVSGGKVCENENMLLSVIPSGMSNYQFITPNGNAINNGASNSLTVAPASSNYIEGTWYLTITDGNGCSKSSTADVSINPVPIAIATSSIVCANADAMLEGNTVFGANYYWYSDAGYTNLISTEKITTVSGASNGDIYYWKVDLNGCSATTSTTIQMLAQTLAPNITLNGSLTGGSNNVNTGSYIILSTTTIGNSYLWTGPNGFTSNLKVPPAILAEAITSGTYYLQVFNDDGCVSEVASMVISVDDCAVTPTIYSKTEICANENLVMTATPSIYPIYKWIAPDGSVSPNTTATITVTPSDPLYQMGTWRISCTNDKNCTSNEGTAEVKIFELPDAIPLNSSPICPGDELQLFANEVKDDDYRWYSNSGGLPDRLIATGQNPIIRNAVDGDIFYLKVSENGCWSDPVSTIVSISDAAAAPDITVNSPICEGDVLTISTSTKADSYKWDGPNGFVSYSQIPSVISPVSIYAEGSYSLKVVVAGCESTVALVDVIINANPDKPTLQPVSDLCYGDEINLRTNSACGNYNWVGPKGPDLTETNPLLKTTVAGTTIPFGDEAYDGGWWQVQCVNNLTLCKSELSDPVFVNIKPELIIPPGESNSPVCIGEQLNLRAHFVEGATYQWSGPNGYISNESDPAIPNCGSDDAGDYSLKVTLDGCTTSSIPATEVKILPRPVVTVSDMNVECSYGIVDYKIPITAQTGMPPFLYHWVGPNGFYSVDREPILPNAISDDEGSYTVLVTDGNNCISEPVTSVVGISDTPPTPSIEPVDQLCEEDLMELVVQEYAGDIVFYEWHTPTTAGLNVITTNIPSYISSVSAIGTDNGKYNVRVYVDGCYTLYSAETEVEIFENPVFPNPSSSYSLDPMCAGGELTLIATGNPTHNYAWTGPNGFFSTEQNPVINKAIPENNGHYTVKIINHICENEGSKELTGILPIPETPMLTADEILCEGDVLELTTYEYEGGIVSYDWTTPKGSVLTSVASNILPTTTTDDTGNYSVIVTVDGCPSLLSPLKYVKVHHSPVEPNPVIDYSLDPSYCAGGILSVSIDGNIDDTYFWTGPSTFIATTKDIVIANADINNNGSYLVEVSNDNCTIKSAISINLIKPYPATPIVSQHDEVCEGELISLTTTGYSGEVVNYNWHTPVGEMVSTTPNLSINPSKINDEGYYSLAVNVDGCESLESPLSYVKVNPLPEAPILPDDFSVCENGNLILQTNTQADEYKWRGPNGFVSTVQYPPAIVDVSIIHQGKYDLTVLRNGCESEPNTVDVNVNPKPETPHIVTNSPVCEGNLLSLTTNATGDSFIWTLPNNKNTITTDSELSYKEASILNAGQYVVKVSIDDCLSDDSPEEDVVINQIPQENAYAGDDLAICVQDGESYLHADNPDFEGIWTTNDDAVIISPNDPNTIIANLIEGNNYTFVWTISIGGCTDFSDDEVIVSLRKMPVANADYLETYARQSLLDIELTDNDEIIEQPYTLGLVKVPEQGSVSVNSDYTINYNPAYGFSGDDVFDYKLCLKDCPLMCDTASVFIKVGDVVFIPDIITPNNDGVNDNFVINGIEYYPENEVYIYNRWGSEVYHSVDYKNDWMGTFKNEDLPDGTYFYVFINRIDGEAIYKGYFTLYR